MILSDLQALVGSLTNDPTHDRYSLSDINTELDNAQNQWNEEIKIIKATTGITVSAGVRQYSVLGTVGTTPISIGRATFNGIELSKRSKQYFDLYHGSDWTLDIGTPREYCIEATDPNVQYITLYPTPQSGDAGTNVLVLETIVVHTPMSASTDVPFMSGVVSNPYLRPYDFYLAYNVAARLLARDPSEINNARASQYLRISGEGKANLIQVFKALEADEPKRLSGGRYWKSGNAFYAK